MMRVLHVITRLTVGGSSENTVSQMTALGRAGYHGVLAAGLEESEAPVLADAERRGCRVVSVPHLGREVSPRRDLAALVRLVRVIRSEEPAIVHTHTSKAGFIGRLAARLTRVAAIVHQPHGHIFYGYYGPRGSSFFIRLERLAARWTDRIVMLTERGTAEHLARRIGRPEQYVVIPSGVPTAELRGRAPARSEARARLGIASGDFVVVGVGRLVYVKGFELLIAAMPDVLADVPTARVILVGEGPERAALERQAAVLGLAHRVRLDGEVSGTSEGLLDYLAAADVCAAPSRNEGMGRALVEAMALGLPVVGAAVGGIPAVIGDDEAGRLVPPNDPPALAAALIELGRDTILRGKLGEAARARAEQFSTGVSEARLLGLYAALAREKGLR